MKALVKEKLFWLGICIRLPLLFILGSSILFDYFIPFLDFTTQNLGSNPYAQFDPQYFPYGSVLLSILAIPRLLVYWLLGPGALGAGALGLFLIKAPLLIIEIFFLRLLLLVSEDQNKKSIYLFFWLNPILIFITYIHGQLDVVAMMFLFYSMYFLLKDRILLTAVFISAAILCKFHVTICLPFFAYFIWNRMFAKDALKRLAVLFCMTLSLSILGFWPLLSAGQALYASASSPEAFRLFAAQLKFSEGHALYLGLVIVTLTLGRLFLSRRISPEGLLLGTGFLLGVLLLATDPRPGWYYWIVPSLALFYSAYRNAPRILYAALIITYFLYFGVGEVISDAMPVHYRGIALTLLQTSLLGSLISLWILALKFEIPMERRNRPMTVGIAGDSGSGKNFLTSHFIQLFHASQSLVLEGDDYHKWERGDTKWLNYTHLNPRANHLISMAKHTQLIQRGREVLRQTYDHKTGRFTEVKEFKPARILFVQGLHSLYLRGMRRFFDVKIYLAPDPKVRLAWKIRRDQIERGQDVQQILKNLKSRTEDSINHIDPQYKKADWIIEYLPVDAISEDEVLKGTLPNVYVKHILWNDVPLTSLIQELNLRKECSVDIDLVKDDIDRVSFSFKGKISAEEISKIANTLFPELRTLTRGRKPPDFSADDQGVSQLVLLTILYARTIEA